MPDTTTVPQGTGAAGTAGLAAMQSQYWKRETLKYVKRALRLAQFGMEDNVPLRNGTQCIWTKENRLSGSVTALTEGVTPASTAMSSTNITGVIAQYGGYTLKSDFVLDISFVSQVMSASENLAYAAAETADSLIRNELTASGVVSGAGGTVIIAGAPTNIAGDINQIANTNTVQAVDILAAETKLSNAAATPFFPNGDFGAVLAAPVLYDLRADTSAGGWLDINKYTSAGAGRIINGEAGKVHGTRLVTTHNYLSTSTGTSASGTCFYNWVFARDSFGIVKLDGRGARIIVKRAANSGTEDPLEQRNSIGYKFPFGVKHLKTTLSTDIHRNVALLAASAARSF